MNATDEGIRGKLTVRDSRSRRRPEPLRCEAADGCFEVVNADQVRCLTWNAGAFENQRAMHALLKALFAEQAVPTFATESRAEYLVKLVRTVSELFGGYAQSVHHRDKHVRQANFAFVELAELAMAHTKFASAGKDQRIVLREMRRARSAAVHDDRSI